MQKKSSILERRAFSRIVFSREERIVGFFTLLDSPDLTQKAVILNVSERGIGFALARKAAEGIRVGEKLQLLRVSSEEPANAISLSLPLEIIWMMNYAFVDHLGLGCQILHAPDSEKQRLLDFVNSLFPKGAK